MAVTDPPAKARRTGGRSARVRAAVLRATLDALLAGGPDAVSIRDIAQRAGVHESSIYRRWETRANLILDAALSETQAAVPVPDTGSLRGDLVALLTSIAAFITTPVGETLLRLAVRTGPPEEETARRRFWAERFTTGQRVLQRAEARGELRPGLDYRLTMETLIGAMHVRLLLTREPVDGALAERVVDLMLAGLAAPGPGRVPGPGGRGLLDRRRRRAGWGGVTPASGCTLTGRGAQAPVPPPRFRGNARGAAGGPDPARLRRGRRARTRPRPRRARAG
jgi:AcrR family transcriptional regulator